MVREICLHYVEKCTGKYTHNKQAARYVYQMAEEVMSQLSAVSAQIKRHENEPAVFQALLDEWNDAFPPGLTSMGSPKAIASLVARQTAELDELRAALKAERTNKDKDIADVLRSMDTQIQTSRNGIISERRQLSRQQKEETENFARALANAKQTAHEEKQALSAKFAVEMAKVKAISEKAVEGERGRMAASEKMFVAERSEFQKEFATQKRLFAAERTELKNRIKEIQAEKKRLENQLEAIMNIEGSGHGGGGGGAFEDEEGEEEEEEESEEEEPIEELSLLEESLTMESLSLAAEDEEEEEEEEDSDSDEESSASSSPRSGGTGSAPTFVEQFGTKQLEAKVKKVEDEASRLVKEAHKREKQMEKQMRKNEREAEKAQAKLERRMELQQAREEAHRIKQEEKAVRIEAHAAKEAARQEALAARRQRADEKAAKRARIAKDKEARAARARIEAQAGGGMGGTLTARNRALDEFRKQISDLRVRLGESEDKYDKQQLDLHKAVTEKMAAGAKVEQLTEMVDMLRQALGTQMAGEAAECHCENLVPSMQATYVKKPVELTHTPHMLGRRDKSGPLKNRKVEAKSGYKTAGKF